jgi:hypothetical protein
MLDFPTLFNFFSSYATVYSQWIWCIVGIPLAYIQYLLQNRKSNFATAVTRHCNLVQVPKQVNDLLSN